MSTNEPTKMTPPLTVEEIKRRRQDRLAAAVTPQGCGSGGWREHLASQSSDFPLQPCDLKKWLKYESLPIERACFVLLGFEPPPLHVLRFVQDNYNPSREPTWEAPPEYKDVLESLRVSIANGNVLIHKIRENQYETKQATWPDLVRWARSKDYPIAPELETLVPVTELVAAKGPISPATSKEAGSTSGSSVPGETLPPPLTTSDIAFCFSGLRWTEEQWMKPLGDKPKWLQACIATPGVQGVSQTHWNPVCIGAALVDAGHAKVNSIRAKFQTVHLLKPWLDAWKTYEADNFDSN